MHHPHAQQLIIHVIVIIIQSVLTFAIVKFYFFSLYNDFEGEVSKVNPLFNEDDDWSQFDSTNSYAVVESTINNGGKMIEDDSSSISSMDEYEVPVDDDLPLTKYN